MKKGAMYGSWRCATLQMETSGLYETRRTHNMKKQVVRISSAPRKATKDGQF